MQKTKGPRAPLFPFTPEIGQRVFFKPLAKKGGEDRLSYYGTVVGRLRKRWLVQLHNGNQRISFDPYTGLAAPYCAAAHILCWVGCAEDYNGMGYEDAVYLAMNQMRADAERVAIEHHRELETYDQDVSGHWKISDLITGLLFLSEVFGPDQVVDINAGYNNVCLELVPEDQVCNGK